MHARSRGPFALLGLVAALAAQQEGSGAISHCFSGGVPEQVVVAFCRDVGDAAFDVEWLRLLQQRHEAKGLRAAIVLEHAPRDGEAKWLEGIPFAVDPVGSLRERSIGEGERGNVALFANGQAIGIGSPQHGFAAGVAAFVDGRYDDGRELAAHRDWMQAREEYADQLAAEAVKSLQRLVERRPDDGRRHALLFLCQWQKANDRAAAAATAAAAVARFAEDARSLAAFADLALRATGRDAEFARTLLEPLQAAAERSHGDPSVQLVRLRALVQAGESREVGRLAHGLARRVLSSSSKALQFAEILSSDAEPEVHLELCTRALEAASKFGGEDRALLAVRYLVALRCQRDAKAARELAVDATEREPGRVSVNNEVWRWLVAVDETGRFDELAVAMVERMLEQREALEFFECDTAAMAMARVGRLHEAVELQRLAIQRGGEQPVYQERLEAYQRAARPAAPR